MGTYAPSGNLSIREVQITLENGSLPGASLILDMTSMTQSNLDLLHYLKSFDFFDAEHGPRALIKIDRIGKGSIYGSMTIKDKSEPL